MEAPLNKELFISVVIPNHNGGKTIGRCLEAALGSRYGNFEVVVVDDSSEDDSVEIIEKFPCRLIKFEMQRGASAARNAGALKSRGEVLFFTDSDCLLKEDALSIANACIIKNRDAVLGGTYTPLPYDRDFFSAFQSVFINHFETKKSENPDYIATHAMIIDATVFRESGGFLEDFLPIIEDVELSHRLRRTGKKLFLNPALQVRHIFNFSLKRSLRNAIRKSRYWSIYSLKNRDVLSDSGTASRGLKINVFSFFSTLLLIGLFVLFESNLLIMFMASIVGLNLTANAGFLSALYRAKGFKFMALSALYYTTLYPMAVGLGAISGVLSLKKYRFIGK